MAKRSFEPVRLGIVGLGKFGQLHAMTLAALAEAELVALVDPRQDTLDLVGRSVSGDVATWTRLDDAIAASSAEAWIVASSTASHVPLTRSLLAAGKPVLVEKPLAPSVVEARSLASLVREDSRNLMVGHVVLFNSEFRSLRARAAERGPIRFIDAVRHRSIPHVEMFPGETPFHLTMVHDLYQVQALMGGREPIRFHGRNGWRADGKVDLAVAELAWEDGAVARLAASFLTPDALGDNGFDRMEVFGSGWGARLSPNPRPIEWWDDKVRWPLSLEISAAEGSAVPTGMLAEELRCFCRVVRGLEPVPVGARYGDAMQVLRWLDALSADAQNNRGATHGPTGAT